MAKKIKFALQMKDGAKVRTLDELRQYFDFDLAIDYYLNGKLLTWLDDRHYQKESEELQKLDVNQSSFTEKFCKVFDVQFNNTISAVDVVFKFERKQRLEKLRSYTSDPDILANVDHVAFNQDDLDKILKQGVFKIYLCDNTFTISLRHTIKRYVGIGDATVVLDQKVRLRNNWVQGEYISFENIKFDDKVEKAQKIEELLQKAYWGSSINEKIDCCQKALDLGSVEAMVAMGDIYLDEFNYTGNNDSKVRYWWEKAALHGNLHSMVKIGHAYDAGAFGYEKNPNKAQEWFDKACELDDGKAKFEIGNIYTDIIFGKRKCKGESDAYPIHDDGEIVYYTDDDIYVERSVYLRDDLNKAYEWYIQAANAGNTEAMLRLVELFTQNFDYLSYDKFEFFHNMSEQERHAEVIKWYKQAALLENPQAMLCLGRLYSEGKIIEQNYAAALSWYNKAYQLGSAIGAFEIGKVKEATHKYNEAIHWYEIFLEFSVYSDYLSNVFSGYAKEGLKRCICELKSKANFQ